MEEIFFSRIGNNQTEMKLLKWGRGPDILIVYYFWKFYENPSSYLR